MGVTVRILRGVVVVLAVALPLAAAAGEAAPPGLPDWFENNRVQAHSEHGLEIALRLTPEAHAKAIRSLGAEVLCRIYKTREEGAWWQTSVGETDPLIGDREFAQEISDAVHAEGMRVIAYYRHMCDDAMEKAHPDWICRKLDGEGVREPRGARGGALTPFVLCMNSPYRAYTRTRVVELAERGVDAIYFDSWHMPDVCACVHCQVVYKERRGRPMNLDAELGSADYLDIVDFVNGTMVETFTEWREAVRAVRPEVFFSIKSSIFPQFETPHFDRRLLAMSDTSGTEFSKPFGGSLAILRNKPDAAQPRFDDQVALGWSLVRDGAGGRPPLMWVPFLLNERTALYSAAAGMTYGCVPQMNVTLRSDPAKETVIAQSCFSAAFDLGKRVSPHLAHRRPFGWAGLHVSAASRNRRLGDRLATWNEVFAPALGAYQALKETHTPWVTLLDEALQAELPSEMKLLVLPWHEELTAEQRGAVAAFEQRGGVVIRMAEDPGWGWKSTQPALLDTLKKRVLQAGAPPIRVKGPEAMHVVYFRHPDTGQFTVCLSNRWDWFRSTREPEPALNEGTPPPPCEGVSIEVGPALGAPSGALEAVAQQALVAEPVAGGVRIEVPEFQIMACVALQR